MKRITTEEFIRRHKSFHGDKYDSSETIYYKNSIKVTVGCPVHGPVEVNSMHAMSSGSGCKRCAGIKSGASRPKIKCYGFWSGRDEQFIIDSFSTLSINEIASRLGRTVPAIKDKIKLLKRSGRIIGRKPKIVRKHNQLDDTF